MTTRTLHRIVECAASAMLLFSACGKTQEPPPPLAKTLGGTPNGAPLPPPRPDAGILADQTTYKPANLTGSPGTGSGRGAVGSGTAAATDAATAAKELVKNLLNDLESGDVDLVLQALDAEQIAALRDNEDFLFNTQAAYASLTRELAKAFGDSSVEQLNADLRKLLTDKLKVDPVSADAVTVTPNPLLPIFGPARTTPTMTVVRKGQAWQVRLEAALTPADVKEMQTYHERFQAALYALAEALGDKRLDGREAVLAALTQVALGKEVNLSAPSGEKPEREPAAPDQTRPTDVPQPAPPEPAEPPEP